MTILSISGDKKLKFKSSLFLGIVPVILYSFFTGCRLMDRTKVKKSFFSFGNSQRGAGLPKQKGYKIPPMSYLSPLLRSKPLAVDIWRAPG